MPQKDAILLVPLCTFAQIQACDDPLSAAKQMRPGSYNEFEMVGDRPKRLCESAVPGSCPRIQCYHAPKEKYMACRMTALIESQSNESGFWMKMPCSQCDEARKLDPATEGYFYVEDTARN